MLRPNFAVPLAQHKPPVFSYKRHIISLDVSDKLAYSASVEDSATAICFLLYQGTGTSPSVATNPVTDFLSDSPAHSESAWPINLSAVGQIRVL
jgi:hypothetical protein